jgi:hypothetical protein
MRDQNSGDRGGGVPHTPDRRYCATRYFDAFVVEDSVIFVATISP